ncbi:MAG TPA: RNA polymerase sigma factor [Saprospiraceae bacterium]|nr:RNA polymerase sigma factor [Saprospiraceae bacterium]HRO09379.1 RNA polymerase sigma factor [Saprospiraceae bacterium]HRP41608.1 RNA polymerase sigma factor [Saprospiraceae bacterium]
MNAEHSKILDLPFKDKVYRLALGIVGNTYDAEDIIQELLIKIWNRIDQYTDIENKEAWCMTVTRNLAIDKVRSRKVPVMDIDDYTFLRDEEITHDKKLENSDRMNSIMSIVNELPEKQRMIVYLRDVEGYSYKEIAEITDNTLDFIKVSLHRARKTLKDALLKRNFKRYDN